MGSKEAGRMRKSHGFTIVELLIVVVVIAILAAITIVAYSGIQNQANNSVVEADINSAAKKLELFKIEHGRYPVNTTEMPSGFSISKGAYDTSQNNVYYCNDRANHIFALGFRSKSGRGYIQTSDRLMAGVSVSGASTCEAIDRTWVNDAATSVIGSGYNSTTGLWISSWKWVN